ncbi:hypothetical protein BBO99_00002532 [Phytophthora kernoviae]|uniref:CCT domain-containing protein n=2 Tax=Phytophthora kernoviae TaxID=325452 RepID=A0A421FBK9_9STRA|nr:hypothetical protein G195_002908 [Phytophthora kernoviae 00238/432]KAG2524496.1 hypothetical protein JM16_004904 [Phytophthora kernoviae]KAG2530611.1 hypothetical protein JM18_002068 [Phytophthora kernoviae]RLN36797.1 hypothetical protein BBI17_002376 [Phytophthora kernoviae]RLN82940.1 hypothetical protein BBO99_00002532 [Phytophthora kernoviae]
MNPMSPIEESKTPMCLSPQDKLKSGGNLSAQRSKRSHATGALAGANDAKKARLDDVFKTELDMDMDGWISDDYLRSMDLDDCLNQDIDWVAHDEVDLALSMDTLAQEQAVSVGGDDVNDFGFNSASFMSPLRGGLAFEDPAEMASTFAYIHLEPSNNAKDAEKLLMSFDTMNFAIPSPTSASRKEKRGASFVDKESAAKRAEVKPVGVAITSAATASSLSNGDVSSSLKVQVPASSATLDQDQAPTPATGSSTPSVSTDSLLSVLNTDMTTPKSSQSSGKKIGSYSPEARKLRLQKFHEKRKNRTWKKSIKYDCRKKLADDRPRIKGRFVRVLENAGDAKAGGASPTAPVSTSPSSAPTAGGGGAQSGSIVRIEANHRDLGVHICSSICIECSTTICAYDCECVTCAAPSAK